jgi:hypothetical protein
LNANNGLALGKRGYINFSLDLLTQAKTYRQVADTNLAATTDALPVNVAEGLWRWFCFHRRRYV